MSTASAVQFAWSGTGFVANVSGSSVSVKLRSSNDSSNAVFFQPVIDGTAGTRFSVAASEGEKTVEIGSGLSSGSHLVELYRETEGKSGFPRSTFTGFAVGTAGDPPACPGRLIEIVGDSISAGYGDLGTSGCGFSTDTESAYQTYGAKAARALGADFSILAASGWGIYSDNGGNTSNVLPAIFGNTLGGTASPAWSFSAKPQAVVINLGTNDFAANASLASSLFEPALKSFVTTVRSKYPNAWIYCAIGPMLYGTGLTNATAYIKEAVTSINSSGDSKVKVLEFGTQDTSKGTGCDYHPNVTEHQRMADVLVTELKSTLGW